MSDKRIPLEEIPFHNISRFSREKGVEMVDALKKINIKYADQLLELPYSEFSSLIDISGVGEKTYEKVITLIKEKSGQFDSEDLCFERIPFTTGSLNFDNMLGGGIYPGTTYCVWGQNATGKSSFVLQVSSTIFQLEDYYQVYDEEGQPVINKQTGEKEFCNDGGYVKPKLDEEGKPLLDENEKVIEDLESYPHILWIDTEATTKEMFQPTYEKRIVEEKKRIIKKSSRYEGICKYFGFSQDKIDHIIEHCFEPHLISIPTYDDLKDYLENNCEKLRDLINGIPNLRLIIMDSLTKLFRIDKGEDPKAMQKVSEHSKILTRLLTFFSIVMDEYTKRGDPLTFIGTNQVYTNLKAAAFSTADEKLVAYGGTTLEHNIDHQVFLQKFGHTKKKAYITDSSKLKSVPIYFQIHPENSVIVDMDK